MPYANGSAGKIAYEKQIDDIQRMVQDMTNAAWRAKELMEQHQDTYGAEKVEIVKAQWQALEDCLDALSGASKR